MRLRRTGTRRPSELIAVASRRAFAAGALLLAAVGAAAQAPAQDADRGEIHASSYLPLPSGAAFAVRPLNDSAANLRLVPRFAEALRRGGRGAPSTAGSLILNFDTEVDTVPLRQQRAADGRGRVRLVLSATIDDSASGRRMWSAEASYLARPNEENEILAQLAQLIVAEIGRSFRVRGFKLD